MTRGRLGRALPLVTPTPTFHQGYNAIPVPVRLAAEGLPVPQRRTPAVIYTTQPLPARPVSRPPQTRAKPVTLAVSGILTNSISIAPVVSQIQPEVVEETLAFPEERAIPSHMRPYVPMERHESDAGFLLETDNKPAAPEKVEVAPMQMEKKYSDPGFLVENDPRVEIVLDEWKPPAIQRQRSTSLDSGSSFGQTEATAVPVPQAKEELQTKATQLPAPPAKESSVSKPTVSKPTRRRTKKSVARQVWSSSGQPQVQEAKTESPAPSKTTTASAWGKPRKHTFQSPKPKAVQKPIRKRRAPRPQPPKKVAQQPRPVAQVTRTQPRPAKSVPKKDADGFIQTVAGRKQRRPVKERYPKNSYHVTKCAVTVTVHPDESRTGKALKQRGQRDANEVWTLNPGDEVKIIGLEGKYIAFVQFESRYYSSYYGEHQVRQGKGYLNLKNNKGWVL